MRNRHKPWFDDREENSYLGSSGLPHLEVENFAAVTTIDFVANNTTGIIYASRFSERSQHAFEFTRDRNLGSHGHFDRKQRPLSLARWAQLFHDEVYRRVGYTEVSPEI